MNFADFIVKYQGKKVDYDKVDGAQCVDLFRQYCKDMGIPHTGAVEGAKDLWYKFSENREKEFFNRFSSAMAMPGDVIIWDESKSNKYGHVALVVMTCNRDEVLVFEQDGFAQDGAKFAVRGLKSALGILRAKV